MNIYTVSFFGHRELPQMWRYESVLEKHIRTLIDSHEYVDFLVGRDGDFDHLASSTIIRCAAALDYGNTRHILVLPYMRADYRDNRDSFLKYYDEVRICEASTGTHYKSAIQIRNRYMVYQSDLVICYIQHNSGGAYQSIRYAEKQSRKIINLADCEDVL